MQPPSIDIEFDAAAVMAELGLVPDPVVIAGRYRLDHCVGAGGGGVVYGALDVELDRRVAVKVLPLGGDPHDHEGRVLAQLSHPNVVTIFDHGVGDDYRWIVLELLPSVTLGDWIVGKDAEAIVAKYLEAARGLAAAHAAGLVHRDFKPANVMIRSDGRAVVVDFGLARNLAQLDDDSGERVVAGTLPYLAPERLVGDVGDHRSDQFSFCVALWEALTGALPFGRGGSAGEQYARIVAGPQGHGVPRSLAKVIAKGLSISPENRYPSIEAMIDDAGRAAAIMGGRVRWPSGAALLMGLGLLITGAGLVASATGDGSGGGSTTYARMFRYEVAAERAAEAGDAALALDAIESAMLRIDDASPAALAEFGSTCDRVALALEEAGERKAAKLVWIHAVVVHRRAGQVDLERIAIAALGR